RQDAGGVEAETGDDLYATAFFAYDGFGNQTNAIEPRGNFVARGFDAVGEMTSEVFHALGGAALATNSSGHDPGGLVAFRTHALGNMIRRVDAAGYGFTNIYDGLDRRKIACGPVVAYVSPPGAPQPPGTPPPVQEASTNYFDAAGRATTNINALGEKTITFSD